MFGDRRSRGGDEYIFVDGRALKADEAVRIDLDETAAPGQDEQDQNAQGPIKGEKNPKPRSMRNGLDDLQHSDAFEIRQEFVDELSYPGHTSLMADDRRKMRRRYLLFGIILLIVVLFSLCLSEGYNWRIYSPVDVISCYGCWFQLRFTQIFDPMSFAMLRESINEAHPMYLDVISQVGAVFRYLLCGLLLALSGMLYQNAFRNPIAAPSMLGISNGMSFAVLILVMIFGQAAVAMSNLYFIFSYIGGVAILLLVLFFGRIMSGSHEFNVVNMLLMGTVISQLLGVVMTFIQNTFMDESTWLAFYEMQESMTDIGIWSYISLIFGLAVSLIPVYIFRFRLNLISFSDEETRMLGVNPNRLRVLALACGSFMILTAQINAGQISIISLVVPFIVRSVFGAEFRKQMVGNCLIGMLVLLVCADITSFIYIQYIELSLSSVVTIMAMPLFVWMLAVRYRSWE